MPLGKRLYKRLHDELKQTMRDGKSVTWLARELMRRGRRAPEAALMALDLLALIQDMDKRMRKSQRKQTSAFEGLMQQLAKVRPAESEEVLF